MMILELGSYVAPAYAGMILAEQGIKVTKWTRNDPIHTLTDGEELWRWLNHHKQLINRDAPSIVDEPVGRWDGIIDNFRGTTWQRWGVDPAAIASRLAIPWVSLRADDDGRSFDAIAQARAWGDKGHLPFYIGDTAAGLWLAFKLLAAPLGHHVIRQATCLAKLVEGELVAPSRVWDQPGTWFWGGGERPAIVEFRGSFSVEPARDDEWRRTHLHHRLGRYVV